MDNKRKRESESESESESELALEDRLEELEEENILQDIRSYKCEWNNLVFIEMMKMKWHEANYQLTYRAHDKNVFKFLSYVVDRTECTEEFFEVVASKGHKITNKELEMILKKCRTIENWNFIIKNFA